MRTLFKSELSELNSAVFLGILRVAMPLSGNWLVAWQIVTTTLYKLLRLVFTRVQRIYWHLNGTAKKLREARLPHNYERSAQVLDVVLYHKFCLFGLTTIENFLFTHNRFENPQYIIDNESITLLTINEHDAIFCEPKEKGMLHLLVKDLGLLPACWCNGMGFVGWRWRHSREMLRLRASCVPV